jgi:hypothetical protein
VNRKTIAALIAAPIALAGLSACNNSDADVASHNVSKAADNFEVFRRVVFFNGITDTYLMTIEGFCSLGNDDEPGQLTVTCKVDGGYKKSFLGLSDNVSYFVEQLEAKNVSTSHYRVIFKPSVIVPDIDVR